MRAPVEESGVERKPSRARIPLPSLALGVSERRLLLGVVDVLALNVALAAALLLRPEPDLLEDRLSQVINNPGWFVLLTLFWLIIASVFDCYDLKTASDAFASISAVVKALVVTYLIYLFTPYISPPLPTSRLAGLLQFLFAVCLVVAWRFVYASVFVQPVFRRRALIVGAGKAGTTLLRTLQTEAASGYHVCGFIDDDPAKQGATVEGIPVFGTSQDLLAVVEREEVSDVILAITHTYTLGDPLFGAIMACQERGVQVADMPVVYENVTGRMPVEHIGRRIHLLLPFGFSPTRRIYAALKRLIDIVGAVIGLTAFALCLPFIVVVIKLDSRGPMFYAQDRVGKGGRVFRVIKLRSMVEDAEEYGQAVWATVGDERITRAGRFLRRTRLDEVPQLVNVLKGEMSLIGPRPERPQFVAELAEQIPFYRARHAVKPGLTGWAQVKYHYGSSVEDALIKLQYDLYYIKHQSFYLDLLIAAKTVLVMLSFKGT